MFGQLEILVDPYIDFAQGTVGVRALQSIDIVVRHAESFAPLQDLIAQPRPLPTPVEMCQGMQTPESSGFLTK